MGGRACMRCLSAPVVGGQLFVCASRGWAAVCLRRSWVGSRLPAPVVGGQLFDCAGCGRAAVCLRRSWVGSCSHMPKALLGMLPVCLWNSVISCTTPTVRLCDAACTAKTTLTHTITQRCHEAGVYVACRQNKQTPKLFSTIARLLAPRSRLYAGYASR